MPDAWFKCPQIRRPNNYEPDVCIMLGPPDPDPTMDLTALDIVKTVVLDSPNKLFVGGLPCDWTEEQVDVRNLLLYVCQNLECVIVTAWPVRNTCGSGDLAAQWQACAVLSRHMRPLG
jgi:hypothetical protein